MHRVKAKVEAEKDKKQALAGQKRAASDDKSIINRPVQRRRSSQHRASGTLPPSPTAISPLTTAMNHPMLTTNSTNPTGSPNSTFTSANVNGTRSFTPQSGSGSSPGGSELVYPFALTGQGIYTPFGNSPPLFPVATQSHPAVQLPSEMLDVSTSRGEDESSGQFWQSLFGPPGSSLPPPPYPPQGFAQPFASSAAAALQQSGGAAVSPTTNRGEFRDPNDVNVDLGGPDGSLNFDDGLVDWSDFIAQCSQVWVTE
jgi:hypothetical protein